MRIKKIEIDNFRAYATKEKNPFVLEIEEKPIVLIYGNNGLGKSSLYDAIEWGITGKIERYDKPSAEKNDYPILRNHFTKRKDGYVKIKFDNGFEIERKLKISGAKTDYNSGNFSNNLNQEVIVNNLVNDDIQKKDEYLNNFNAAHLLSQELLSNFIKEKNQGERYKTFLTLYGLNMKNEKKYLVDKRIREVEDIKKTIDLKIENSKDKLSKEISKLKSSSDNEERIYLEENLKRENPLIDITAEVLENMKKNYLEQSNNSLVLLKRLKRKKELIEKKSKFEEENNRIYENDEEQKKLEKKKELLKKNILIEKIGKKMLNYSKYCNLISIKLQEENKRLNNQSEKSQLDKLENEKELLDYFKEEEKKKVENYFRNTEKIKKLTSNIEEEINKVNQICEMEEKFIISSITILESIKYTECPLCGNDEFDINLIEKKLKKELTEQSNPLITLYREEVNRKEKELEFIIKENREIINELIKIKNKKLEINLDENKKIDRYFSELKLVQLEYEDVEQMLKELNISIKEYDIEKKYIEKELENNPETLEKIEKKLNELIKEYKDLDTENLKDYNDIKKEDINLEKLIEKIENIEKDNVEKEEFIKKIFKLLVIYEDNKILKNIEDVEKVKKESENNLKNINQAIQDLNNLKKYIDYKILEEVNEKSVAYEDKIQYLYTLLSPHRNFTKIKIRIDGKEGNLNNTLRIEIFDENNENLLNNPVYLFSSAQINTLAIAIFLTFSLDNKWSKLNTILLDDPIQNMDDINIYNFIDLIRRVSEQKQVIISTHDDRIKEFIVTKFGEENIQVVNFVNYGEIEDKGMNFHM